MRPGADQRRANPRSGGEASLGHPRVKPHVASGFSRTNGFETAGAVRLQPDPGGRSLIFDGVVDNVDPPQEAVNDGPQDRLVTLQEIVIARALPKPIPALAAFVAFFPVCSVMSFVPCRSEPVSRVRLKPDATGIRQSGPGLVRARSALAALMLRIFSKTESVRVRRAGEN